MRVLVSAASKYGATTEIAEAIARTIGAAGHDVTALPPGEVRTVDGYDACVLGSAVYVGHWLEPMRKLVEREAASLKQRLVWLFSSGPIGDPPAPREHAVDVDAIVAAAGAREHRLFPGRIDKQKLGFAERAVVFALRVPDGDFRDWDEIAAWAREIVAGLETPAG